jgi:hypothetical protein
MLGPEQRLRAADGKRFDDVDVLAAAVVAASGVTLGVFVREDRASRLEHRGAHEILRGDELESGFLTVDLALNRARDVGIHVSKRAGRESSRRGHIARIVL